MELVEVLSTYHFEMLILCTRPQQFGTEASFCINTERVSGDVLLPADVGAGGQVQVGAGPPEALAGWHSGVCMARIHNSLIFFQIGNQLCRCD